MRGLSKNILSIGIGASIGTIGRYSLNVATLETGYPLGTLIENITGSFVLGFLTALFAFYIPKEWVKLGLGVGLCGGFTTMSTLAADTTFLFNAFSPIHSAIYLSLSMFGGILLAIVGFSVGTLIAKRRLIKKEGTE
ncbi:fluoride efflux transporter FluC [Bacillus suaedae]|uniref:Fluoride-specific ion channel FluC n=1 Tax=Halalkalibacter suaedae TaxID=2822140 RepID=A0A940WXU4_9BACI|nr:CrcB family protein [Bacillus suaedae]MBP3949854.1 CrcB family protein [Bacillus suaedae]